MMARTLALLLVLVAAAPAVAQTPALHRTRLALRSYDTEGDRTVATVEALRAFLIRTLDEEEDREARFLRAVVVADLYLIGTIREDAALRGRAAAAFGSSVEELPERLIAELEIVRVGPYAEAAGDAIFALSPSPAFDRASGPRRDFLFVRAFIEAAESGAPITATAALAADPCRAGTVCPPPYATYDARGRRALRAFVEAGAAVGRLEHFGREGDPFSAALSEQVASLRAGVAPITLAPTVRIPDGLGVPAAGPRSAPVDPEVVIFVGPGSIRYGVVPRARIGDDGVELSATAAGDAGFLATTPAFPDTAEVPVPHGADRAALAQALRRVAGSLPSGARPAVFSIAPDTAVDQLAAVLLAAGDAGLGAPVLLARGDDGSARGLPLRLARSTPTVELRVRVRLGGYTVTRLGRPSEDIPRLSTGAGLQFDLGALAARAASAPFEQASLSFMHGMRAGPVLDAAFAVAPDSGPLTLTLR